jgi:hypothetical protein
MVTKKSFVGSDRDHDGHGANTQDLFITNTYANRLDGALQRIILVLILLGLIAISILILLACQGL